MRAVSVRFTVLIFKISVLLQLLYCLGCLIVVICMPLYTAFYPTAFGDICFKIGAVFTAISTFNPLGIAGTVCAYIVFFMTDMKKSNKALVWIIVSPLLIALCWYLSITFFVKHSGGV